MRRGLDLDALQCPNCSGRMRFIATTCKLSEKRGRVFVWTITIPIFNIVFLVVLLALLLWFGIKIRKLFKAAGEKSRELTGCD